MAPCKDSAELLKKGHMNLGVRIATANPILRERFKQAVDTWATILDFAWHEDDTRNCSIAVIDGEPDLFQPSSVVARAQMPDRADFRGLIAFNPGQTLSDNELLRVSMHELGHLFGLHHNASANSLMYEMDLEGPGWLEAPDLDALAKNHRLREPVNRPLKIAEPVLLVSEQRH